jgi:hypothetical protein
VGGGISVMMKYYVRNITTLKVFCFFNQYSDIAMDLLQLLHEFEAKWKVSITRKSIWVPSTHTVRDMKNKVNTNKEYLRIK